mgnify:CR=1 FL=1
MLINLHKNKTRRVTTSNGGNHASALSHPDLLSGAPETRPRGDRLQVHRHYGEPPRVHVNYDGEYRRIGHASIAQPQDGQRHPNRATTRHPDKRPA